MPLKLREMEVLHAVVKTRTMSAAARQLRTSQPAVSQFVRAAEGRLGVALFVRDGNRVRPTPEMLELFDELELIFNTVESARRLAVVLNQGAGRVLRIGALPSVGAALLPPAIARLRERYPGVQIVVRFQEPAPVKDAVVRRDFDLGLMYAEAPHEGLDALDLGDVPVVGLVRADDPLAAERVFEPACLAGRPLISFARMSPIGADLDGTFARAGVAREVAVHSGHSHAAAEFVRQGLGVALTDPFFLGVSLLADLAVRPFAPRRTLTPRLVHVSGRSLSAIEIFFLGALRDSLASWRACHTDTLRGLAEPAEGPPSEGGAHSVGPARVLPR